MTTLFEKQQVLMVGEKLVPLALVMAVRFGERVSDAKEVSLWAGAIPDNTKASTEWGTRIWNEWATSRATAVAAGGIAPLTTPFFKSVRYLVIAHLSVQ